MRRIVGLLRPYWRRVTVAFALGAAMMVITTVIPLIVRTIIDQGLTRRVPGVLGREVALLLLLVVAAGNENQNACNVSPARAARRTPARQADEMMRINR